MNPEKPKEINDFRRGEIVLFLRLQARKREISVGTDGPTFHAARYEAQLLADAADFIETNRSE